MGSAHLRHLLEQENFGTRKGLAQGFILSFFNLLWGTPQNYIAPRTIELLRSKLRVQILQGPHTEGAILKLDSSACRVDQIPMLVPEFNGVSIGILHDTAVQTSRRFMANFLAEEAQKMGLDNKDITDEDIFVQRMNDLGDIQYKQALFLDEFKTPIYELKFPGACCGTSIPIL